MHELTFFTVERAGSLLLMGPLVAALQSYAVVLLNVGRRPIPSEVMMYGLRIMPVVIITQLMAFCMIGGIRVRII